MNFRFQNTLSHVPIRMVYRDEKYFKQRSLQSYTNLLRGRQERKLRIDLTYFMISREHNHYLKHLKVFILYK